MIISQTCRISCQAFDVPSSNTDDESSTTRNSTTSTRLRHIPWKDRNVSSSDQVTWWWQGHLSFKRDPGLISKAFRVTPPAPPAKCDKWILPLLKQTVMKNVSTNNMKNVVIQKIIMLNVTQDLQIMLFTVCVLCKTRNTQCGFW